MERSSIASRLVWILVVWLAVRVRWNAVVFLTNVAAILATAVRLCTARAYHYGTLIRRYVTVDCDETKAAVAVDVMTLAVAVENVTADTTTAVATVLVTPTVIKQFDVLSDAVAETSDT
jgi:hypothetical protein